MKDNICSVSLETSTAPVVKEIRGKDWISYGTEEWANLFPQFLIDLYYNSSTQAAIINATAEMIAGQTGMKACMKLLKRLHLTLSYKGHLP